MIGSFRDRRTAAIFRGLRVQGLQEDMQRRAQGKLLLLDAARDLGDLAANPGNRLEKLAGTETWSIRINRQWRITFRWREGAAEDVQVTDYH